MKKILSWETLVLIAVVAFFIRFLSQGRMIKDAFSLIGGISLIMAYFAFRKFKKIERENKGGK